MCCSCVMMSPKVTSPEEVEGVDEDGAEHDRAEREEGAVESDCGDQNWALLCLAVA